HEARLARARRAEYREQVARAVADRVQERVAQHVALAAPPHERRLEPACAAGDVRYDGAKPECVERLRLALHGQRLERLRDDRIAHELIRTPADQRLTRRRV